MNNTHNSSFSRDKSRLFREGPTALNLIHRWRIYHEKSRFNHAKFHVTKTKNGVNTYLRLTRSQFVDAVNKNTTFAECYLLKL